MPVRRYLLFDSGCSLCTRLAGEIEHLAGGRLQALSLSSPQSQGLLARANAAHRWKPALVEVRVDGVRAYSGSALGFRLLRALGPRRAWRVFRLFRSARFEMTAANAGRRRLLARGMAVLGGMIAWTIFGSAISERRALAAEIDNPRGLDGESSHRRTKDWRDSIQIKETKELTETTLVQAAETLQGANDMEQLRWLFKKWGLGMDRAILRAANHALDSGNNLLAVAASWVRGDAEVYVAGYYALLQAVDGFQTVTHAAIGGTTKDENPWAGKSHRSHRLERGRLSLGAWEARQTV